MQAVPLNAIYDFGNAIGPVLAAVFGILLAVMVIYVMKVYLFPKEK